MICFQLFQFLKLGIQKEKQNMKKIKIFLEDLLESHDSKVGRFFGYFLLTVILLSTLVFVLETTTLERDYGPWFHAFDLFAIVVFTFEYISRIWIARDKKKAAFSLLGIIDLLVLISFYTTFSIFSFMRGFRVLRILQVLKIVRYSEVVIAFVKAFRHYKNEMNIFLVVFGMSLLLSSSGMYYLEKADNPNFTTIPDSLWWTIVTVSTLGYGDVVPVTAGGKFLTAIIVMGGLASIAILTAVVTKVFMDHFFGKRKLKCVYCHYPNHDYDAHFCKNCGGGLEN